MPELIDLWRKDDPRMTILGYAHIVVYISVEKRVLVLRGAVLGERGMVEFFRTDHEIPNLDWGDRWPDLWRWTHAPRS